MIRRLRAIAARLLLAWTEAHDVFGDDDDD
jgi:hypothetical protein